MPRPRVYILSGSAFGKLRGTKLYYLGFKSRPKFLPENGRGFGGLKHLLEHLTKRFGKFSLTITTGKEAILKSGKKYKIRISEDSIKRLRGRKWDANRDVMLRLAAQLLHEAYPKYFPDSHPGHAYQRGIFAEILDKSFDSRLLAPEDKNALTRFVLARRSTKSPSALDIPEAYDAAKDTQLLYLKRLADEFESHLRQGHDEPWWQKYFEKNILYFQNNYITRIEKMNTTIVGTQFPDFSVATADGYLDIIEIKKPATELLKEDTSRHNFYWSTEMAKAISQVENYLDSVMRHSDAIVNILRDKGINLRIIKPRGLIFAGKAADFSQNPKMSDDFRRLNACLKNLEIVPYDEISRHIRNTIESIHRLGKITRIRLSAKRRKRSRG